MLRAIEFFSSQIWALEESVLISARDLIVSRIENGKFSDAEIELRTGGGGNRKEPTYIVDGDTAIIPIVGIIGKRFSLLERISHDTTNVQTVRADLQQALDDPRIKQIHLQIESPGGTVSGVPELADFIFESRGAKPIIAYADGLAASAAYWLAAAADKVYASKSTQVGSIGVYTVIQDYTVRYHNEGVKAEVIRAGKHKASGHPLKGFSNDDRNYQQGQVNEIMELFKESIQKYRKMTSEQVDKVATGEVWLAKNALSLGLIDGVAEMTISGQGSEIGSGSIKQQTKEENMDFEKLTAEDIQSNRPDLYESIQKSGLETDGFKAQIQASYDEGVAAGKQEIEAAASESASDEKIAAEVTKERDRAVKICDSALLIDGTTVQAVKDCIVAGDDDQKAFETFKGHRKKSLAEHSPKSPGPNEETDVSLQSLQGEEKWKQEFASSEGLQREFKTESRYLAYKRNMTSGNIKTNSKS